MGPLALFDKSFLQSLTVEESLWFDHFFSPVVCPVFFVETLADLSKEVRPGRTPEREVRIIADKFPEMNSYPCTHHLPLGMQNLQGVPVPMDGTIPRAGGTRVELEGKVGIVYDNSPEAEAFSRWQEGEFEEVERDFARAWREALGQIDLKAIANGLRALGIDSKSCRDLEAAKALADSIVSGSSHRAQRMQLAILTVRAPSDVARRIMRRWERRRYPPVSVYAPYTAYLLSVEMFFQIALASQLIGTDRATNRVDFAYLNYLPFGNIFVSTDKLHRRCAPLFLREDQEFIWGPDLKKDLARINSHFSTLPDAEKERGIDAFAATPPKLDGSLVRTLRDRFLGAGYDDRITPIPAQGDRQRNEKLVCEVMKWADAAKAGKGKSGPLVSDPDSVTIHRRIRSRKGSFYQVPKGLKNEPAEDK